MCVQVHACYQIIIIHPPQEICINIQGSRAKKLLWILSSSPVMISRLSVVHNRVYLDWVGSVLPHSWRIWCKTLSMPALSNQSLMLSWHNPASPSIITDWTHVAFTERTVTNVSPGVFFNCLSTLADEIFGINVACNILSCDRVCVCVCACVSRRASLRYMWLRSTGRSRSPTCCCRETLRPMLQGR